MSPALAAMLGVAADPSAATPLRLKAFLAYWVLSVRGARRPSAARWRYHGRWCGPGVGSGAPIDALDSACRLHDEEVGQARRG